ncbi:MAG: hypothetical protein LiPW41_671 [Parcubacteria group bacterium LiPW_41]|nr:MAG: hypothetical protein LiPW41_671 [Parcubacteria group bacterium LiPW_41]
MNDEKICCPQFDPTPWDGKEIVWENKKFIKDKVCTLFYMPINFGSVVTRMITKVEKQGASVQDWLCLSDHTSLWNMDLYLAVDKDIPNAENTSISGKFVSKVYEGKFSDTGKWVKEFNVYTKEKGYQVKKQYLWYTTCPKCAKKYGKNYVVLFAQI